MGQCKQHLVGNKVLAQSVEAKTKTKTPGFFLEPLLSFLSLGMRGIKSKTSHVQGEHYH